MTEEYVSQIEKKALGKLKLREKLPCRLSAGIREEQGCHGYKSHFSRSCKAAAGAFMTTANGRSVTVSEQGEPMGIEPKILIAQA